MRILWAVAALLSGCGGEVIGSLEGHELKVAEVALMMDNQTPARVSVWLSDRLGLCNSLGKNEIPRNADVLELEFIKLGDQGQILLLDPGTYPINIAPAGPGRFGGAFFSQFDNGCVRTLLATTARGASGTIELESLDVVKAKRGTGRFDVTFGNGDKLKGTFDAPLCDFDFPEGPASCD